MAHLLAINPTYTLQIVNFSIESSAGTNIRYNTKTTITGRAVFSDATVAPIALTSLTASTGSVSGNVYTPPYLEIGATTTAVLSASCKFGNKVMQSTLTINVNRPRMNMTWTVGTPYQGSPGISYAPISLRIDNGEPSARVEYELFTKVGSAVVAPKTLAGAIDGAGNLTYNHICPSAAGEVVIKTYINGTFEREESFKIASLIIGIPNSGSVGDSATLYFNNCKPNTAIYYTYNNPAGPTIKTSLNVNTDMFGFAQMPVSVGIYPGGSWTATFYAGNTPSVLGTNTFTWVPKITSSAGSSVELGATINAVGHNLPANAVVSNTLQIGTAPATPPITWGSPATSVGEWTGTYLTSQGGLHTFNIFINSTLYGTLQVNVKAPAPTPTFTVSSNEVFDGAAVIITGYDVQAGTTVKLTYAWNGGPETFLVSSPQNTTGTWSYTLIATPAGSYVLKAYVDDEYVPGATTTVLVKPAAAVPPAASPSFTVSSTEIFVGESVIITGYNVPAGSVVKITHALNGGPEITRTTSTQSVTGTWAYNLQTAVNDPTGQYILKAYINDVYVPGATVGVLLKPLP